jgi:cytosine/adenosine deaminase-related metal-dependent hydrolase
MVVHCPRSNQILHKRQQTLFKLIQPFPKKVAIATDSIASNKDLEPFERSNYIKKRKRRRCPQAS